MPAELEAKIDAVENEVTRALDAHAVRFRSRPRNSEVVEEQYQIRGVYLVPATAIEPLLAILTTMDTRLKDVIREWANNPDRLHEAIRAKLGGEAYELVKSKIPSGPELLEATSLAVVSLPLGVDVDDLRTAADSQLLSRARQRTTEMLQQVSESVVAQPRQELADAISQLQDLIGRDGRVTARSFVPIRRAIEKLSRFDFVMDDVLRQKIQELSRRMDALTPSDQDSRTSSDNGLLGVLQELRETAVHTAAITKYASKLGGFRVSTG